MAKDKYDFGEKKTEIINGSEISVGFKTPKYEEAKRKATELIDSEKYKGILLPSDFWILVNTYKNKTKAMYSGLIISHDGCLKINDTLDSALKFKPECLRIDKDGYNCSLVYTYICSEQGLYEVGEVSAQNCKQDYPYAMALKRCFDRVVLKNSKIAYSGIYSDSEADEFAKRVDETEAKNESGEKDKMTKTEPSKIDYKKLLLERLKELGINIPVYVKEHHLGANTTQEEAFALLEHINEEVANGN